MYECMLVCMSVYPIHVEPTEFMYFPGTRSQMVVSHHVTAGNRTPALKEKLVLLTTETPLQSQTEDAWFLFCFEIGPLYIALAGLKLSM